ncbi:MAG: TIGR03905 family TSCPD domain-containing protein [Erysipelotrichaceae bacterium]
METITYKPKGVCSKEFIFEVEGHTIKSFTAVGGCNGNLKGIGNLLVNRNFEEVISLLEGTTCGPRTTSCPDQIAQALKNQL